MHAGGHGVRFSAPRPHRQNGRRRGAERARYGRDGCLRAACRHSGQSGERGALRSLYRRYPGVLPIDACRWIWQSWPQTLYGCCRSQRARDRADRGRVRTWIAAGDCGDPGIDALFIGRADLAASFGCDWNDPKLDEATARIAQSAADAGIACGAYLADPAQAARYRSMGISFLLAGSDQGALRQDANRLAAAMAPDEE